MDQATIIGYAVGYVAAIVAVFLLFLPIIISFGLLMLLAGAVRFVILILKAMTVGFYRSLVRLFRAFAGRLGHGRGGGGLVPH
ncbi:hypothetical protein [Pseudarthrobacter albicanus]|uniref:hypothetical protein n=1 Tax=Pseudarthrobacter albicanus TaxID=2823873 RepID=UPI001BA9BD23|nr:hypothetical protein [Pseudarthrobacter albicanus]